MKLPKVLIFTITYEGKEYCYEEFAEQFNNLNYPKDSFRHVWIDNSSSDDYSQLLKKRGHDVIKVSRGNNSREALARSQNVARNIALEEGYDYMLSIESDLLDIPANIIQQLIGTGRDMVGAAYAIGPKNNRKLCITLPKVSRPGIVGTRLATKEEEQSYLDNPGVYAVNSCGLGCTLIKREVFEKVRFTYLPNMRNHSDVWFANDVWRNGFQIFVHTGILLRHENVPWAGVQDR